jgi:hypothetical protein
VTQIHTNFNYKSIYSKVARSKRKCFLVRYGKEAKRSSQYKHVETGASYSTTPSVASCDTVDVQVEW